MKEHGEPHDKKMSLCHIAIIVCLLLRWKNAEIDLSILLDNNDNNDNY